MASNVLRREVNRSIYSRMRAILLRDSNGELHEEQLKMMLVEEKNLRVNVGIFIYC